MRKKIFVFLAIFFFCVLTVFSIINSDACFYKCLRYFSVIPLWSCIITFFSKKKLYTIVFCIGILITIIFSSDGTMLILYEAISVCIGYITALMLRFWFGKLNKATNESLLFH